MAQFNSISSAALMRLIGTPNAPLVIDVRIKEDVAENPCLIPTAQQCPFDQIEHLGPQLKGQKVIVVCHKGLKLSHGVAARLRHRSVQAQVLEGGMVSWIDANLPAIPIARLPQSPSKSLWVTKQRPKIDRIACPWLIRRFVDPNAEFLFVPADEVLAVAEKFGATAFDVDGSPWTHNADRCSFDSLLSGLFLSTEPLERMAAIVRGADTNAHHLAPECAGLLAVSVGLSRAFKDDLAQLEAGLVVYDALYRWARDGQDEGHDWPGQHA